MIYHVLFHTPHPASLPESLRLIALSVDYDARHSIISCFLECRGLLCFSWSEQPNPRYCLLHAGHIDHANPHTFEVEDLHKLILKATHDLEELDAKRRDEFKKYEMEKELKYQDTLKNMTEADRKAAETKHEAEKQKHRDHPRVHHPGSKAQLEQVWEEQDHMPKEEFNPKTFFAMHDINGDGVLDQEGLCDISCHNPTDN